MRSVTAGELIEILSKFEAELEVRYCTYDRFGGIVHETISVIGKDESTDEPYCLLE